MATKIKRYVDSDFLNIACDFVVGNKHSIFVSIFI